MEVVFKILKISKITVSSTKAELQMLKSKFCLLVRAECVRCPWLLAQKKVATILGISPSGAVQTVSDSRRPLF